MQTKEYNFYHYDGPLPLGSVIAHNCGAAGLFVAPTDREADYKITAVEIEATYQLEVFYHGESILKSQASLDTKGRKTLGKEVLYRLRQFRGLAAHNEWGSLVGVRPTKLYHKLWDQLDDEKLVANELSSTYDVSSEVIDRLAQIARLQRPYLEQAIATNRMISLYSGIPFCQSHCIYCSFPYGLIQNFSRLADFVKAYLLDIANMKQIIERYQCKVDTLYMGGGTPTSLNEEDFATILTQLTTLIETGREFTVEAGRPDSVTPAKIKIMQKNGVNRISINPQCMHDDVLKAIGRAHKASDIEKLYNYVKENTDFVVNMDFIAGLPQQNFAYMQDNLDFICRTRPENVTIHTLALKRGSPLYEQKDRISLPSVEEVKEMVDYSRVRLEAAGYKPYYLYRQQYMTGQLENIGYTLPGFECQYNIQMMEERETVISMGPGSSSKWMKQPEFRQKKQHMPKDLPTYLDHLQMLLEKRNQICENFWEREM